MLINKHFITSLIAAAISMTVYAEDFDFPAVQSSRYYVGGQVGLGSWDYNTSYGLKGNNGNVDNHLIAGRIYAGQNFTDHLGAEVGLFLPTKISFRDNNLGIKEDFFQYGIDISGIANLSFDYGFGAYLKAGGTMVYRGSMRDNQYFYGHNSTYRLAFLGGAGVTYAFADGLIGDIGLMKIFSDTNVVSTNFYSLGLTYNF
jgi:hypothetical protein